MGTLSDLGGDERDSQLLKQWLQGDRGALHELMLRHEPEVRRFFRSRLAADADDLTQETLLAMVEARDRFRGDASFKTYLLRIARFKLWSHRRRRQPPLVAIEDAETELVDVVESEPSANGSGLEQALCSLAPSLSRVIRLALEKDLTREAIASELGLPPGTVASRIRTAKTQLKTLLMAADF
jgi:RNA polymerase sigma factor (sigma-70 family)